MRNSYIFLIATIAAGLLASACGGSELASAPAESAEARVESSGGPPSVAVLDFPLLDPDRVESSFPPAFSSMSAELAFSYGTVGEISRAASGILVGRVMAVEYQSYSGLPFTVTSVLVMKSLKGTLQAGELATVVETGGIHAGRSKLVPGAFGEPREVGVEGVPVMKEGEHWLLFLIGPSHVGPVSEGAYSVSGVFQGKLRLGKDGHLQFTGTPGSLMGDELFAVPAALAGKRVDEAILQIQDSVR
ncbi:MAG: hypothetical protein HY875_09955 [Chloroflexi bacterium]|nr:hypothetical protein [Chloroflexota bacterium]